MSPGPKQVDKCLIWRKQWMKAVSRLYGISCPLSLSLSLSLSLRFNGHSPGETELAGVY